MKKALSTPKASTAKAASPGNTPKAPAAARLRRTPKPAVVTTPAGDDGAVARPPEISVADVARRAYELFLSRNGEPGDPVADWLRAEQELKAS